MMGTLAGCPRACTVWTCTSSLRPSLPRSWLEEASTDFRVGAAVLNKLQFAAWGCGNSLYAANFNAVARRVERQLLDLGARKFTALGGPGRGHASMREGSCACV
jgi:sulfite reductase alpha subunit-like flavoprotein